jgi:hypothetical protein
MKKTNESIIEVTIEAPSGINSQTGKSEEIEILNRITNRFKGTQTYLSMLFTENLVEWFNGKVRDDFSADLFMEYQAEMENNRNLSADLQTARTSINLLNKDKEDLKILAKAEIDKRDKTIGLKEDYIHELSEALADVRREHREVIQERMSLSAEVTKLKVMLFDLQNNAAA